MVDQCLNRASSGSVFSEKPNINKYKFRPLTGEGKLQEVRLDGNCGQNKSIYWQGHTYYDILTYILTLVLSSTKPLTKISDPNFKTIIEIEMRN